MEESHQGGVFIVGLGHHYPPFINGLEDLKAYLERFSDTTTPAMQKLLQMNRQTNIKERPNIIARDDPLFNRSEPPTISELDALFRVRAVDLAARACRKAIADWGGSAARVTHTVATTGTNAGSPGYDTLVNDRLGIRPDAQRMLLSGIGCAGGLATIRAAATIANDATLRGRPARILGFACDLTSTNIRCDLQILAEHPEETRVSMALFSDAAAAFVVCNARGLLPEEGEDAEDEDENEDGPTVYYSVLDWESGVLRGTQGDEQCLVDPLGFRSFMSPGMPDVTSNAVAPMLERMLARNAWQLAEADQPLAATDLDWAVHPAGIAVLDKVRELLKLEQNQMRVSFDVLESKGNSASPTVLIVLDKLRVNAGGPLKTKRQNVVACSFGPGVCTEMLALRWLK